jgi:hypothetical protein
MPPIRLAVSKVSLGWAGIEIGKQGKQPNVNAEICLRIEQS